MRREQQRCCRLRSSISFSQNTTLMIPVHLVHAACCNVLAASQAGTHCHWNCRWCQCAVRSICGIPLLASGTGIGSIMFVCMKTLPGNPEAMDWLSPLRQWHKDSVRQCDLTQRTMCQLHVVALDEGWHPLNWHCSTLIRQRFECQCIFGSSACALMLSDLQRTTTCVEERHLTLTNRSLFLVRTNWTICSLANQWSFFWNSPLLLTHNVLMMMMLQSPIVECRRLDSDCWSQKVDRNSQWSKALVGDLVQARCWVQLIKGELLSEHKTVLCQLRKVYGSKHPGYM